MCVMTAAAVNMRFGTQRLNEEDTYISYLPAAHSFEQALFGCAVIYGMKTGFFSGDLLKLVPEDIPAL